MQFYLKQPKSNICFCVVSIGVFKTGMKKASFQFSRYPIIQEHWVVKSKVINIYITQRIYCKKYVVEKGFLDNTDSSFARVQGQVKEKIKGSYRDIKASRHSSTTKYLRIAHWKHKSELEELLKKSMIPSQMAGRTDTR